MRRALSAAALLMFALTAAAAPGRFPLVSNGEVLANACTSAGQGALRRELTARASKPDEAWRIVHALLCAPANAQTRALLRSHLGKTVEQRIEATGSEDETQTVPADDDLVVSLPQAGAAWDAGIDVSGDDIALHFWADEASVRGRTLRLVGGKWRIIGTMDASD